MQPNFNRRSLFKAGISAAFASTMLGSAAAWAQDSDPYLQYVHPQLRTTAQYLLKDDRPSLSMATLAENRAGMAAYGKPPSDDIAWEKKSIPGAEGQPDVTIYIINAKAGTSRPAILHTHGGGYVLGDAVQSVSAMQEYARELDAVIVSVDYRLAPETTFEGSIEDNYSGLKWLHKNAEMLGADPDRIAVMGESAGGGHAALLAITARDRGEVPLAFQCLTYPMLDDRTGTSRQMPSHVGKIIWNADSNRFGWSSLLGVEAGGDNVPIKAVPARIENLAGLPPAFIGVGSIDLFHDEDVDYAQRLNAVNVPTELIVVPGAFHGFDGIGDSVPISTRYNQARMNALKMGLGIS